MKFIRLPSLLLTLIIALAYSPCAWADLVSHEPFDLGPGGYTVGLVNGQGPAVTGYAGNCFAGGTPLQAIREGKLELPDAETVFHYTYEVNCEDGIQRIVHCGGDEPLKGANARQSQSASGDVRKPDSAATRARTSG
jgi:hypothetical protein